MSDSLDDLEIELEKLESRLPEILASGDRAAARDAGRRHQELVPVVETYRRQRALDAELAEAEGMLGAEPDQEMREYLRAEVDRLHAERPLLTERLRELLVPRDPNDGRNVIVEIRGGEGGDEANIWAGDLFRMYQHYAEERRWKLEVLASQASDMGSYRDITFLVKGADAWERLKHEAGPHRVQRVPVTESQGRIHTSAATVAILPEADEVDVEIDSNDLEIDVFRATGPGGQSVNTTDSAVRITHVPTGLVVSCQDEKSQLQNKEKAMRILRARLLAAEQERQDAETASTRRDQVKGGNRSEKIRTYNYKDNRVTDHRIGLTLHALEQVLGGKLDPIVDELAADERRRQLGGLE